MTTLSQQDLRASLQHCFSVSAPDTRDLQLDALARGLSGSGVWRVHLPTAATLGYRTLILKVPDLRAQSPVLGSVSRDLCEREHTFAGSDLPRLLAEAGVTVPRVLALEKRSNKTWLWMEDIADRIEPVRERSAARRVVHQLAKLDALFRSHTELLESLPWLGRREFLRYAHLLPAAQQNLARLKADHAFTNLSPSELEGLGTALTRLDWASAELERAPQTLLHGDFHIGNVGIDRIGGHLILFDWAHTGLGPRGGDLASFISLYGAFGGEGGALDSGLDAELIATYAEELRLPGETVAVCQASVQRVCGLWHMTWGLHLRLGAGLTALYAGVSDEKLRRGIVTDIEDGARRALSALSNDAE